MTPSPFEIGRGIGGQFAKTSRRQRDLSALDSILMEASQSDDPQAINMAMTQILSTVSPERQPQALKILQDKMTGIREDQKFERQQLLKQEALEEKRRFEQRQKEEERAYKRREEERKRIDAEEALMYRGQDPSLASLPPGLASQELKRETTAKAEAEQEQQRKDMVQRSFDRLVELVPNVGKVKSALKISPSVRESIGEFNSLTGALESLFVEMVNKGTLSNVRFKYITEQLLPKASDTKATIRGKLKGIAIELGLDAGNLIKKGKEKMSEEETKQERAPVGVFDL